MLRAAAGGHLEVLTWLHGTGCPWDEMTCRAAAARGHLDVVKWLHNTGCPWGSYTCDARRVGRAFGCVEMAAQYRVPVGRADVY